ncbi:hypothetical protein [Bacillus sp. BP-3]|uniref:hypothetical protein n=1 Tax=Bacillus sp. BP-3 TaxID=3022773 RepID=UPI00232E2556|nr:hypothetical protein [Bacillus sp. BP-3]MDC2867909.1 hypothetical protein [Bacillus sp. BP-3]
MFKNKPNKLLTGLIITMFAFTLNTNVAGAESINQPINKEVNGEAPVVFKGKEYKDIEDLVKSTGEENWKPIHIPTKKEKEEFFAKQRANIKQGFAAQSIPDDWPHVGDILVTSSTSSYGLTGHSGIIISDSTMSQGENVVHIAGPGYHPRKMSTEEWAHRYPKTAWLRYKDRTAAYKAGRFAEQEFLVDLAYIDYRVTPGVLDQSYTYCSELVYQSYAFGAGVHFWNSWQESIGIIKPYDFLDDSSFKKYFSTM